MSTQRGSTGAMMLTAMAIILLVKTPVESQPEQVVEVVIKNFTYAAKQKALRLGVPTAIKIVNEDSERHDFGSTMFEGIPTTVETGGISIYGRGVGGVMLDPRRDTVIRFDLHRPGRHEFRCSIHTNMKGELLLLSVEAA